MRIFQIIQVQLVRPHQWRSFLLHTTSTVKNIRTKQRSIITARYYILAVIIHTGIMYNLVIIIVHTTKRQRVGTHYYRRILVLRAHFWYIKAQNFFNPLPLPLLLLLLQPLRRPSSCSFSESGKSRRKLIKQPPKPCSITPIRAEYDKKLDQCRRRHQCFICLLFRTHNHSYRNDNMLLLLLPLPRYILYYLVD